MPNGMGRPSRLGLPDRQTNLVGNSRPILDRWLIHSMLEWQPRWYLYPKNKCQLVLHAIKNIDKRKCIVNDMVQDSYTTAKKWHQSATLVWYDCLVYAEMMALTTLLRLSIHHDGDHQCKAWMHSQHCDDGVICSIKTPWKAWKKYART